MSARVLPRPTSNGRGQLPSECFVVIVSSSSISLTPYRDGSRFPRILGKRSDFCGRGRSNIGPDLLISRRSRVPQQTRTWRSWPMPGALRPCARLYCVFSHFHPTETASQGLTKHSLDQATRQSFLIVLIELAKRRRRLPDSIVITEKIMAAEEIHTSGLWDVRRGTLDNSVIAVKTPRFTATTDVEKIREVGPELTFLLLMSFKCPAQRFCREAILWSSLSHPNVLKLIGVLGSIDAFNFSTVSEWMPQGTITGYTMTANVNRLELVSAVPYFSLCSVLNSST